jgi:E3 ubiquitin-protein ligase UBR4
VPRLFHCVKLLKLLKALVVEFPPDSGDIELLNSVSSFVDSVPALLKLIIDFGAVDSASYGDVLGSVLLKTVDEFVQFVRVAFRAGDMYRTIEVCLVVSMLEILSVKSSQHERLSPSLRAPLVFSPRIVQYLLKSISAGWWMSRSEGAETICDLDTVYDGPSCLVRSEKVRLLEKHTYEEFQRLVFPPSEQWIDDLIHLVLFLHTLAIKSVAVTDKPRTIFSKTSAVSDTESVVSHDDEAIFGDLFAEASRPSGPSDAAEKPVPAAGIGENTMVSCSPIQVVAELVSFLKTYIFLPGWDLKVHKDACAKVCLEHINQLLSLLSCQNSSCAEKIVEPPQSSLNELCFDLLHSLMICCEIPLSIKENLVHQVMLVENGAFVYNHYTLTLVAQYLVSEDNLGTSTNLRIGLFSGYLDFLLDKVNNVILTESNDSSVALPCAFHLEMLLMAFHLSSQSEKKALASQVFSTLKKMTATPPSALGLSVWGLLVSRVFLLLRHMLLYPSSCPIWLLSRFRAKMREIPIRPGGSASYMNEHLPSLVSSVLAGMFGDIIREFPVTSSLLPWLIDVAPLNAAFCQDELQLQNLGLDLLDMIGTISNVLSFWKGQRAKSAELLIVERYLFLLFLNTILAIEPGMKHTLGGFVTEQLNLSDVRLFISFSLNLVRENGASSEEDIPPLAIVGALNHLHNDILLNLAQVDNWDFLRRSSGLSLLLSIINAGLDRFARSDLQARSFYNLGENMVKFLDEKQAGDFINDLACMLETYLRITQQASLSFLDQAGSPSEDQFCPVLLLKHTAFDKSEQNLLLGLVGFDLSRLETLYGLLHKLDGIRANLGTGKSGAYCLSGSLFHGFPVYPDSCNGTLLSCILVVQEVIGVIDGILKVMRENKGFKLEASVACRVLKLVMTVNSDRIFGSLLEKCDAVSNSLINEKMHLKGYVSLFALKQLEEFLTRVTSEKGLGCEIREMLISRVADSIEVLKKDSSKLELLKFYLGCDDSRFPEGDLLFGYCHADLLALFIALDECESQTVNLKVIGLLVDLLAGGMCSSLKEKLRKRFLDMDTGLLSNWLKVRLLGTGSIAISVRDLTVEFLMHLMSPELQTHLGESMVVLIDTAFLQRDLQTAEPYFSFLVKLLSCESASMKLLLESILKLMEKMVEKENLLAGLKFILMFFEVVIGQSVVANKPFLRKVTSKISSTSNVASGCMLSTNQPSSGKNTDNLQLASDSVLAKQVDITSSGEEDEDDGTTDGELASVDRDHEEEDMNSERVLASKVCTFTSSGSNFMEQHWYFCYTCDLTVSKGCCSVCAQVCHRGHRVVYSRSSRFFCDCGAGGVRGSSCQCLKPRKFTGHGGPTTSAVGNVTGFQTFVPYQDEGDPVADSCSDLDDEVIGDASDCSFKLSIPKELQDDLQEILQELGVESQIVEICRKLLPGVTSRREDSHLKDKRVILGAEKRVHYTTDLFQLKKAFKSGSLDLKIKADYPNSRELKLHLSSGSLAKSLLSVSVRGKLAVGEGDKVAIFDIGQLIGQPTVTPVTADKTNVKPLSKNMVRFEIVHLMFNPLVESYLAVVGYEECQVLTVNSRGEVTDRLAIELALTDGAYVRKVEWVPGSQVQLMVASNKFVKIYDLSQDNISPVHYFTLENDRIVDTALLPASMGKVVLLVLSEAGLLYKFEVTMEGDVGARTLTDLIEVEGKGIQSRGVSLYFSSMYRLLFLAYQDGTTLLGRLDPDSKILSEVSYVNEDVDGKVKPVDLHHWRELIAGTGIFSCQSGSKSNVILTVALGLHELTAQNMKHSTCSNSVSMVGVAAYKPLSKDKTFCLVLYDDGGLHIFSCNDTSSKFFLRKCSKTYEICNAFFVLASFSSNI